MRERRHAWTRHIPRGGRLAATAALFAAALLGVLALAPGATRAQTATSVAIGTTTAGDVLVGPNGMTLYLFTRDAPGVSNCSGGCLTAWPPLLVDAGIDPTAAAGLTGTLAVIDRAEGRQVTYNGWPLYYYAQDAAAGDAVGENVGGVWFTIPTDVANQVSYLTAQDQALPSANTVTVRTAAHSAPFYIAIHEGTATGFGDVIGASALMAPGMYANVVVPTIRPLANGEYVWPMLHTEDSGNTVYDSAAVDLPINAGAAGNADFGGIAVFSALIGDAPVAAPVPAAAATGNAGLTTATGTPVAWLVAALALAIVLVGGARAVARRR